MSTNGFQLRPGSRTAHPEKYINHINPFSYDDFKLRLTFGTVFVYHVCERWSIFADEIESNERKQTAARK